jgi:nicotinate-nucleotide pyrophosphorylase (carboxylating)
MLIDATIETLIRLALEEDLGTQGDVTTLSTIPSAKTVVGQIRAKAAGVIAGLPLVQRVYACLDTAVDVQPCVQDGDIAEIGTLVCEVRGTAQAVLSGERVALNFLQRLSGVATLTAQFVAAVKGTNTVILDTRKTTPGWRTLEKYAVRMGGGQNHRMGLYDMVLIKDNHIDASGGITAAVQAARANPLCRDLLIEVEVKNQQELREALSLNVNRILLDNMTLEQMQEAVSIVGGRIPLEASGNMTLNRVRDVAATGVNYISVGALTHSAPALDLSMRLEMKG